MRLRILGVVGLLVIGGTALAEEPLTLGGQFQVNTYTTGQQYKAAVAADAQGEFVVVWGSLGGAGTDLTGWSIQAQRYDSTGLAVGGEFQVNTYTTSSQEQPTVAADDLGNFVVAWEGKYQDDPTSNTAGILAQRYDDSGTPVGDEFQVNSFTTSYQRRASVGVDQDGDFVVAWESAGSYGSDTSHWSVQAQRFDSAGSMIGGEFQVNSFTTSHQYRPSIAVNARGDFVVAWQSNGSYGTDTDSWSIQAQRFDTAGEPVGDQFQVNSYTTGAQEEPAVASDAQGNFVVLWESLGSYGSDTSGTSIQGQFYDACGAPVGGQFQVNSYTTDKQESPVVSSLDSYGTFVVAWQSLGSVGDDTSNFSVQAQRYRATTVFADCFESGDTSHWTNTDP